MMGVSFVFQAPWRYKNVNGWSTDFLKKAFKLRSIGNGHVHGFLRYCGSKDYSSMTRECLKI